MNIKAAIAAFKAAEEAPERFDVFALGVHIGSATHWGKDDEENLTYYWNYYPRSPTGIIPYGDIVIDWDEGSIYMFNGKEGEETITNMESPVNLIEAITKEL